jgi:hypothetical protein
MRSSVISWTGQSWKLVVSIALLLIGTFGPLVPSAGLGWTAGTILAVVGYAFGVWFIVCPTCGDRWFWSAALDARLYGRLFGQPACPSCKRNFQRASS